MKKFRTKITRLTLALMLSLGIIVGGTHVISAAIPTDAYMPIESLGETLLDYIIVT